MSALPDLLTLQLADAGLPEPVREFRFAPPRRWRFDYCWPSQRLAVEIEGGAWSGGRHTRGAGFLRDMEKYDAAVLLGYAVLRFTPQQVESGHAVNFIRLFFETWGTGRRRAHSLKGVTR